MSTESKHLFENVNEQGFERDWTQEMKLVGKDIEWFLRMAAMRIENKPDAMPFKPVHGHQVIGWLRALANRYGNGEDISGSKEDVT